MTINRRDLFKVLGAGVILQSCVPHKNTDSLLQNTETIYSGFREGEPYVSKHAGLTINSPFASEKITFANEIHSIIHSQSLNVKVFISKLELLSYGQVGDGIFIQINPDEGNYFYGHGVIDEKRKVLYTTQARITKERDDGSRINEKGYVYVHSIPDFKIIEKFPTFGNDPHDMKILNDELIVCNGGAESSITFISLNDRKLVREFKVNVPHLSLRHIEIVDDQNFLIATLTKEINRATPLYGLNLKEGLKIYKMPEGLDLTLMRIQLLSILHHKGYIFATCPATNTVLVWNLSGEFIGGQNINSAASLAYSKQYDGVIVGSGNPSEKARLITVNDGKLKVQKLDWATGISGAHSTIV